MTKAEQKLLLVDDDKAHRTMLKAHLGGAGYAISEADDGDVAVHLLKERSFDWLMNPVPP